MINSEPKQQLLSLIDVLKLPITPEDAIFHLDKMTDEEIESLLRSFKYVVDYQNNLEKEAMYADPERYALAEATYQKELRELHENFLNKLEEIQKKHDETLDASDKNTQKEIENLISEEDKELDDIEKEYLDLASKLSSN